MKKLLYLILVFNIFLFPACSNDDDDNRITSTMFQDAAADTAPVFEVVEGLLKTDIHGTLYEFSWGNVNYEIFNLMREYDNAIHEGDVGIDNMYKALYQAGSFFQGAVSQCTSITESSITPPFNFGNTYTYNCAGNNETEEHGFAVKQTTDEVTGIIGWRVYNYDGAGSDEKGVLEGYYNSATGEISLDLTAYVYYATTDDYSMRIELEGNELTHEFTIRLYKYTGGGYSISIIGNGISQGTGNYFLFKIQDTNALSTPKYFCYEASDVNQEFLQTKAEEDYTGEDSASVPAECSTYKTVVDAMTFFEVSDVPVEASDFNTGITDYEGTIYLSGIE